MQAGVARQVLIGLLQEEGGLCSEHVVSHRQIRWQRGKPLDVVCDASALYHCRKGKKKKKKKDEDGVITGPPKIRLEMAGN